MSLLKIFPSGSFKKDLERISKRKGFDIKPLKAVINMLSEGINLPLEYHDHKLTDSRDYRNCRECHVRPDLLLVYRVEKIAEKLLLLRTGTHSDLFR